jgi:hypothetical protein
MDTSALLQHPRVDYGVLRWAYSTFHVRSCNERANHDDRLHDEPSLRIRRKLMVWRRLRGQEPLQVAIPPVKTGTV